MADLPCDHRMVPPNREVLEPQLRIGRHRHLDGYVSVVVAGGYEEIGDRGRRAVRTGDVLVHFPFDGHSDVIGYAGATVLNLSLPADWPPGMANGAIDNLDALIRAATETPDQLAGLLLASIRHAPSTIHDWPDQLAHDLRVDPSLMIGRWADAHGLNSATVSRGFRQAYDISPAKFRYQMRAKSAWQGILCGRASLSQIALDTGFADQSHMTRAVAALTGRSPSRGRARSNLFKNRVDDCLN